MARMTVHVPDELLHRLRAEHPEINWAAIVRRAVVTRVEELEAFEEMKKRGVLR